MRSGGFFRSKPDLTLGHKAPAEVMEQQGIDCADFDRRVAQLFELVADRLADSISTLLNDDRVTARRLIPGDHQLDLIAGEVEMLAEQALLDCRYRDREHAQQLLLVIQIVPEMERSGDLVQ